MHVRASPRPFIVPPLTSLRHDCILDRLRPYASVFRMRDSVKKITANIPAKLLQRAQVATGLGITATLVAGLEELDRSHKRSALRGLQGKVRFELDLERPVED